MAAPYSQKAITLTVKLGKGTYGESGFNTVTLSGLRVEALLSAAIRNSALSVVDKNAEVRVFGLTLDQINQLTHAGTDISAAANTLAVSAGDATGMTTVFSGNVYQAFPDMRMPDSGFVFLASGSVLLQMKPAAPSSYSGTADVATVMGNLASQAGLGLENNGVNVKLSNPYFSGTIGQQIAACAYAAGIYCTVDDVKGVLAIWPKTGYRAGAVPVISPETGMIGYPQFQVAGVRVRTLFNPEIYQGEQVQIQSQLTAASGIFSVFRVDHNISAQLPEGPWETEILAYPQTAIS